MGDWDSESGISSDPRHDISERKLYISGIAWANSVFRVSEKGMVELIHESTSIVDKLNFSSDQMCDM